MDRFFIPFNAFLLALLLVGCDSKLSSKDVSKIKVDVPPEAPAAIQNPDPVTGPATPAPVEVPLGDISKRRYFQSRDVVHLTFSEALLADANSFSLENSSNGKVIVNEPMIDGHTETQPGVAVDIHVPVAHVAIYPGPSRQQYLSYGDNVLLANGVDGQAPKDGKATITVHDFPVFDGAVVLSFTDNVQTSDGLQTWVSPVANSRVGDESSAPGEYGLSTGIFNYVNE
jgi:hypothetical protein